MTDGQMKWTEATYKPHTGPLPSGTAEVVFVTNRALTPEEREQIGSLLARCIKAEEEVGRLRDALKNIYGSTYDSSARAVASDALRPKKSEEKTDG